MLTSGDVVEADLGEPVGREAGFPRPVVVMTAQVVLAQGPTVVHVVPLTSTRRGFRSEIDVEPDDTNGLEVPLSAQCQHLRSRRPGSATLWTMSDRPHCFRIRETIADLLDL